MSFLFYNLKTEEPATSLEVALLHGCFSRFLNCTNDTKSRNASHIVQIIDMIPLEEWGYSVFDGFISLTYT